MAWRALSLLALVAPSAGFGASGAVCDCTEIALLKSELDALKEAFTITMDSNNGRVITLNGQLRLIGEPQINDERRLDEATDGIDRKIDQQKPAIAIVDRTNVVRAGFSGEGELFVNDASGKPRQEIRAEEISTRDGAGRKRSSIRKTGITIRDEDEEKLIEVGHEEVDGAPRDPRRSGEEEGKKGISIYTKPADVEASGIKIRERREPTEITVDGGHPGYRERFEAKRDYVRGTSRDERSSFEMSESGDIRTNRDGEESFVLEKEGLSLKKDGEDVLTLNRNNGDLLVKGDISDPVRAAANPDKTVELCERTAATAAGRGPSAVLASRCRAAWADTALEMSNRPLPVWANSPPRGEVAAKCPLANQVSDGRGGCVCADGFYKDRAGACTTVTDVKVCDADKGEISDRRGGCMCARPLVRDRTGACIDRCAKKPNMVSDARGSCECAEGFYKDRVGACVALNQCGPDEVPDRRGGCMCARYRGRDGVCVVAGNW